METGTSETFPIWFVATDDFFPTDLDFSSFFQDMDSGPSTHSSMGPQMGAQLHDSHQSYNGYNGQNSNNYMRNSQNVHNSSQWINGSSNPQGLGLPMRQEINEEMDETDWDYLLSLGIGPSVTKDDPSGTALLRQSIANTSHAFDQQMINSERIRAAKASRKGVIMIPPLMPRSKFTESRHDHEQSGINIKTEGQSNIEDTDVKSDHEGDEKVKKRKKMKSIDPKDMTEEQLVERR